MTIDPQRTRAAVEAAFEAAWEHVASDAALRVEYERCWREFGGAAQPRAPAGEHDEDARNQDATPEASAAPAEPDTDPSRERRCREWFLLERPSDVLGAVPIEAWAGDLAGAYDGIECLLASHAAVYEVLVAGADRALRVRDLLARAEHVLDEPEVALELRAGDLIVGRIFPVRGGAATLSPAAIWVRDAALLAALQRDLETLRASRRGVLRISQAELERMFFAPVGRASPARQASGAPRANASATLRGLRTQLARFLSSAGMDDDEVEQWLDELAEVPLADRGLMPGGDDVLGRLLGELAMRSDVDLEQARALVLTAWQAADRVVADEAATARAARADTPSDAAPGAARSASRSHGDVHGHARDAALDEDDVARAAEDEAVDETEGAAGEFDGDGAAQRADAWSAAAALAEFDRERGAGADLESAFRALEQRLGIPDDDADGAAADTYDAPGVLDVLIDEYAWDRRRAHAELASAHERWLRGLAAVNAGLPGLEDLDARLLVQFAAGHAIQSGALDDADDVRTLCDALLDFATWCEHEQDHPLRTQAGTALAELRPELERVTRVNRELRAAAATAAREPDDARALEVLALHADDRIEVADGRTPRELRLARRAPQELRVGDWIQLIELPALRGEALHRLVRAYPPQAAAALTR